jgi:hypothetical protein
VPQPHDIEEHLIRPLAKAYGEHRDPAWLAGLLAKSDEMPDLSVADLSRLANQIIHKRKNRSFPMLPELLSLAKALPREETRPTGGPRQAPAADSEKARDEAYERGLRLLRGTPLAMRAIEERWAPELINFATTQGRAPCLDEEAPIIGRARRNDKVTAECWLPAVRLLRETMHTASARRLGGGSMAKEQPGEEPADEWDVEVV